MELCLGCLVLMLFITINSAQHDPLFQANRSTIVQLFEWTFEAVAEECERFLGPNGFGAVMLSPVTENLVLANRPWYERYQPMSYQIASRSGNASQLQDMVERCNRAGIRTYLDVVINHMAGDADEMIGTAGSRAVFANRSYPSVPYVESDFHKPCNIIHYRDAHMVRNCDLYRLPDLDQSLQTVRDRIVEFLNRLVAMGVAGFRIGSCKHMWPNDLKAIYGKVNNVSIEHGFPANTRPFMCQEVSDNGDEPISKTEYTFVGAVLEITYALQVGEVFVGTRPLNTLKKMGPPFGFVHSTDAIVYLDSHDLQRTPSNESTTVNFRNLRHLQTATAFMLAHDYGCPIVMSSYEFASPLEGPPMQVGTTDICSPLDTDCRGWLLEHRLRSIVAMVQFRNAVDPTVVRNWQRFGADQVAFCRGNRGFIAINNNKVLGLDRNIAVCVAPGEYCDVMSIDDEGKCRNFITVDDKRNAQIQISMEKEIPVVVIYEQNDQHDELSMQKKHQIQITDE